MLSVYHGRNKEIWQNYDYKSLKDFVCILCNPKKNYNNSKNKERGEGMGTDYAAMGKRIQKLRKQRKLTQAKLAERVGLEKSNISHMECGVSKPSIDALINIANELGVTLDALTCDSLDVERKTYENELIRLTRDCTTEELRFLTDTLMGMLDTLRKRHYRVIKEEIITRE